MSHCRNGRERIVIFVKALLKHEEKSCRDTLAIVHDSYNSVIEAGSSSISTTVATG
jgi:hypothetical protein